MPPRPRHSRISNCGNFPAISSGAGGGAAGAGWPATLWEAMAWAMRQDGQSWCWLPAGTGFPHSGQTLDWFISKHPYAFAAMCYKNSSGKRGKERPHFILDEMLVGERAADFLTQPLAVALPQAVHRDAR